MKLAIVSLLWAVALAFVFWSNHASAVAIYDVRYQCDGGPVTFGLNHLEVQGQSHRFIDSAPAVGQHEDGSSYKATAYEFGDNWYLVMADASNDSALAIHDENVWYCDRVK